MSDDDAYLPGTGRGSAGSNPPRAFENRPGDDSTLHSGEGGGGEAAPRTVAAGRPLRQPAAGPPPRAGEVYVLQTRNLARSFTQGGETIEVLRSVDLQVAPGEIVALLGPSGSGKSTLLQAVGLLEGGFSGSIRIAGEEAASLDAHGRTVVRRDRLGFVYQFHHLLPDFNAMENVVLPQLIHGAELPAAQARAETLLAALGLGHRLTHRPAQLSGGEQQRVAVARALANRPALVLADEPTGNLDEHTAGIVLGEFLRLVREEGSAALVATHNERLAAQMDRVVRLHEGQLG
jgi:lipoprotein-releasing system ATP-binding protein